ncbi:MAG: nucleotidyltransferase substrate binding protein [Planctomycetota bacterium]
MKLDLSSLRKAVESLERTLKVANNKDLMAGYDDDTKDAIRAGVIQNFEFTYEMCWKFMKRRLEIVLGSVYVDGISRHELFRLAAENQLIRNVEQWMEYHDARNETSHTYDEERTVEIFEVAGPFSIDARKFMENLEKKNA